MDWLFIDCFHSSTNYSHQTHPGLNDESSSHHDNQFLLNKICSCLRPHKAFRYQLQALSHARFPAFQDYIPSKMIFRKSSAAFVDQSRRFSLCWAFLSSALDKYFRVIFSKRRDNKSETTNSIESTWLHVNSVEIIINCIVIYANCILMRCAHL